MSYNAIISSIPKEWKRLLKLDALGLERIQMNDRLLSKFMTSKKLYSQLLENKFHDDRLIIKRDLWQKDLLIQIEEQEWHTIVVNSYYMFSDSASKYFAYRLIHRLITTNVLRHKYDSTISPSCAFCNNAEESVIHLFWSCPIVKKLWKALERWVNYIFKMNWKLERNEILLLNHYGFAKELKNTMSLITLQYIYSSKCQNLKLNFQELIKKMAVVHSIEKRIALENNRMYQYYKKWKFFSDL